MISDNVLAVGNSENTATDTPPSFPILPSTSLLTPLESQCQDPFCPTAWRDLTSVVRRPRHWQLASSTVSVTVSPSPQSKDEENEKLHELRRYARDFQRQHTTDAERFNWDSDDEDYGCYVSMARSARRELGRSGG
jgi:N-acetyl-beta-hexosaminidase